MIVRGCHDINQLFEAVEMLGPINKSAYQEYLHSNETEAFTADANGRVETQRDIDGGPFGFWLPHGLGDADMEETLNTICTNNLLRFDRIEEAFDHYYSLTDTKGLPETP